MGARGAARGAAAPVPHARATRATRAGAPANHKLAQAAAAGGGVDDDVLDVADGAAAVDELVLDDERAARDDGAAVVGRVHRLRHHDELALPLLDALELIVEQLLGDVTHLPVAR